jgi:hypothetical protein
LAVTVALDGPLKLTVVPAPLAAGVTLPDRVQLLEATCAVKFTPDTLDPAMLIDCVGALNVKPVLLGVTT